MPGNDDASSPAAGAGLATDQTTTTIVTPPQPESRKAPPLRSRPTCAAAPSLFLPSGPLCYFWACRYGG
ncbi:phosphatidylinositol-glycan biosynthesis class S protein [Colletotrichum tofieldiae]|nr:phosphatidylinositol-glycan biosynthesis class S protein [Colletotrichum tofieldiae]